MNCDILQIKKGDTWNGLGFEIKNLETNVPLELTDCHIVIQFKKQKNQPRASFEYKEDTIDLYEPLNGKFRMKPRKMDYDSGIYYFDAQVTFPNGTIKTVCSNAIEIKQDISS